MRSRRRREAADETEIDMTPMLDIVFIMLIFFIVTTSYVKESGIDFSRPSGKPTSSISTKPQTVVISLNSQNDIAIDGRAVDVRLVRANVARMLAEAPDAAVLFRAHQDSSTEMMIAVVNAAKEAGVDKISVATYEKDN